MRQTLPITESLAAFGASAEYRSQALAYGVERIPESGFIANYPRVAEWAERRRVRRESWRRSRGRRSTHSPGR